MKAKYLVLTMIVGLAGCGDDEPANNGTVNEATAKSNAMQTISAVTALTASTDPTAGQTAAMQLMGVAQGAQGIVTPNVGMGQDNCACEGTTCTFQDCETGATVTGTMSWTDGEVVSDLTYDINQGAQTYNLTLKTNLTVTETSINGTVASTGSLTIAAAPGNGDVSWNNLVDFMNVTYSGGNPTGGSMFVDATTTVAGQSYGGSATVDFP